MRFPKLIYLISLSTLLSCKPDPIITSIEEKKALEANIETLRERFDQFKTIAFVEDAEFKNALLIETEFYRNCRVGPCKPMSQDEMEVLGQDLMFSYMDLPELQQFDGVILKLTDMRGNPNQTFTVKIRL